MGFFCGNPFAAAQHADVGSADICHNPHLRMEHTHKGIHLSLVVYTHLEHAELMA